MLLKNKFWFKVCRGEKGKKYYVLSESFWKWIENEIRKSKKFGSKSKLVRKIREITKNGISGDAAKNWIYRYEKPDMKKPKIISDSELKSFVKSSDTCIHGNKIFCHICKFSNKIENCPVPLLWRTDKKGKIYVFDEFWHDLINNLKNCQKYGVLPSSIYKNFDINDRVLRKWKNENIKPLIYSKNEFNFNPENSYWLGMHFSDGHLRNNGSKISFTWQSGSSNPFQGYWFPQFIQNFMDIFRHKPRRSLTYINSSKIRNTWFFSTNLSSFSPIFAKFLETNDIVSAKKDNSTAGYYKNLPKDVMQTFKYKDIVFQGIMDGDGSYNISKEHGIHIAISLDPNVGYDFIEALPLVPTTGLNMDEKQINFEENNGNIMREIRFAPSSLRSMSKNYSAIEVANQIEFMLRAAENSIRPDKVHKLIKIVKRLSSKKYGKYKTCLRIQGEIRDEIRRRKIGKTIRNLEKRFPESGGFYKPFIPKWSEKFASKNAWKQEFWDFFLNGEYLVTKNYPKPKSMDFSSGVPIDFNMTQTARN